MSDTESLSADDLKNRLYHSLREKGLVDTLKSQLRNRLITELKQVGVSQDLNKKTSRTEESGSLLQRAADSLVADHLRRCHYDYSLSVYLPECGIPQDKLFTTRDLLQLLNINPHSPLYKKMATDGHKVHMKGFLWEFLCEIARQHGSSLRENGCQTDGSLPPQDSLLERLRKLDEQYASIGDNGKSGVMATEERILSYQRMLDERSRTEYNLEIARFKEQELARMRLEEKEKCRIELEATRREMERSYQTKSDALLERERHSIERLQKQTEMQERETYSQRQSTLAEIEAVRSREADLKRQADLHSRQKALLEDRMKTREDLVKKREDNVRRLEIEYEQRLRDEVTKFKLEEQSRLMKQMKDVEFREMRVKDNERRVDEDMRDIKQIKDELREKRIRVNEIEAELHRTKHDLIGSQKQSELLSEKCREMVDYQMIKEENAVIKRELDSCKQRLAEAQRDIMVERQKQEELLREMTEKASQPTPEVYMLQKELEKARSKLRQEQVLGDHEKIQSTNRIHEELDRNKDMVRRFEEQTLQQREMNREMSDLRQQLFHFKQALNNEMYRNPKIPVLHGRRSPSLCDADDVGNVNEVDLFAPAPSSETFGLHTHSEDDVGLNSNSEDLSLSNDLVLETKRRLRSLEAEADNLEQNYRSFQFRMTNVPANVIPMNKSSNSIGLSSPLRSAGARSLPVTKMQLSTPVKSSSALNSSFRPMSSTPNKLKGSKSEQIVRKVSFAGSVSRLRGDDDDIEDKPALNMSVSTVRSTSPIQDVVSTQSARTVTVAQNKAMSISDLEAKPGEPSVMVIESSHVGIAPVTPETFPTQRISPSGQEGSESSTVVGGVSLDSAWKKKEESEMERKRREEEEDREFEERMRKKEDERRRKEQESREREQQVLQQLEGGGSGSTVEADKKADPVEEPGATPGEPTIDPVMQKYMDMVAKQKEKEKEITKKAVGLWSKGRTFSEDKTPEQSISEDLSVDDEKSAEQKSDGDFEW